LQNLGARLSIFDFDGTLFLASADGGSLNPAAICIARHLLDMGFQIAIITGRSCESARFVRKTLELAGINVKAKYVLCNRSCKTELEWKLEAFEEIRDVCRQRGCQICEYHEDNPSVLREIASKDREICLYLYVDGLPALYRKTERCVSHGLMETCAREKFGI